MNSLYSLSVVAPMMRTSPRASTDLNTFAASDGAPSAEPAPIIVCTSSMNRMRFGRSLISRMTFWIRSSNMPRSIVPATIVFICRLTTWQSRRRTGTLVRLELDAPGDALGDGRLADARLAEQQDRIGALPVAEDLEHAVHFARRARTPGASCPGARAGSGSSRSASGTAAARTASSAAPRAARDRACGWRAATRAPPARCRAGG